MNGFFLHLAGNLHSSRVECILNRPIHWVIVRQNLDAGWV